MPFLSEPEKGGDESCSSGHNPTIPDQYQPASLIINNSLRIQSQSFSHRKCDDVTCIGSVSSSLNVVLNIYFNEFGALYYDVLFTLVASITKASERQLLQQLHIMQQLLLNREFYAQVFVYG